MKIATAFSGGFGSVEFAFKYLGIDHEIVFACEIAEPQRKSYILNHGEPKEAFYHDIREIDCEKHFGQIDYYHLSPPCQSYSMAGNRAGVLDDRGGLMFEAIRSIAKIQPNMFTVENVKGLLSVNNGEDWKRILRDFNSLEGYTISVGVMNAKEQGSPQNRERVFIVGFRGQCPQMHFPQPQPLKIKLKDILEKSVDEKYFLSEKTVNSFIEHRNKHKDRGNGFAFKPKTKDDNVANTISTKAGGRPTDNFVIDELIKVGSLDGDENKQAFRVYSIDGIASNQVAKGGGAGAKTGLYIVPRGNNKCGHRESDALPSITRSSFEHNCMINDTKFGIRRLTPREVARDMGDFDDKFQFGDFSDTKLYEFIGNAIDISTMKNLIDRMFKHSHIVKWNKPKKSDFALHSEKQFGLFVLEVA